MIPATIQPLKQPMQRARGQTCVAMLCGVSFDDVVKVVGKKGGSGHWIVIDEGVSFDPWPGLEYWVRSPEGVIGRVTSVLECQTTVDGTARS